MIENRQTGEVGAWQRGMITCLSLSVLSQTLSSVANFNGYANDLTVFQLLLQDNIQVASESNLRRRENSFPDKFDGKNS